MQLRETTKIHVTLLLGGFFLVIVDVVWGTLVMVSCFCYIRSSDDGRMEQTLLFRCVSFWYYICPMVHIYGVVVWIQKYAVVHTNGFMRHFIFKHLFVASSVWTTAQLFARLSYTHVCIVC
jgi:hypothetical protein